MVARSPFKKVRNSLSIRSRSSTCRIAPAGVNVPGVAGVTDCGCTRGMEVSSGLGIDMDMSREGGIDEGDGWLRAGVERCIDVPLLSSSIDLLSDALGSAEVREEEAGAVGVGVDRWNEPRFKRRTQAWFEKTISAFHRASTECSC